MSYGFQFSIIVNKSMALGLSMEIYSACLIMKLPKVAAEKGPCCNGPMVKSCLEEVLDDFGLNVSSTETMFQSLVPKASWRGWLDAYVREVVGEGRDIKLQQMQFIWWQQVHQTSYLWDPGGVILNMDTLHNVAST